MVKTETHYYYYQICSKCLFTFTFLYNFAGKIEIYGLSSCSDVNTGILPYITRIGREKRCTNTHFTTTILYNKYHLEERIGSVKLVLTTPILIEALETCGKVSGMHLFWRASILPWYLQFSYWILEIFWRSGVFFFSFYLNKSTAFSIVNVTCINNAMFRKNLIERRIVVNFCCHFRYLI